MVKSAVDMISSPTFGRLETCRSCSCCGNTKRSSRLCTKPMQTTEVPPEAVAVAMWPLEVFSWQLCGEKDFILWGYGMEYITNTSSTAQGGGGSFRNRKPIGEVGCCESRMAERSHWWTDRWLRSPLFLSLSFSFSDYLPTYLSIYLSNLI